MKKDLLEKGLVEKDLLEKGLVEKDAFNNSQKFNCTLFSLE